MSEFHTDYQRLTMQRDKRFKADLIFNPRYVSIFLFRYFIAEKGQLLQISIAPVSFNDRSIDDKGLK